MVKAYTLLPLVSLLPSVLGHALITSPPTRQPGEAHIARCGRQSFDAIRADVTSPIEGQNANQNGQCVPTLCRGMVFEDQPISNIQTVVAGQQMTMDVNCTIPHGGPTNVTLVDTTTGGAGTIIGPNFLRSFNDYCPVNRRAPLDQTKLSFNLPDAATIGGRCGQAGQCVVQLFWATPDLSQTYYYCIDLAIVPQGAPFAPEAPNLAPAVFQDATTGPVAQFPLVSTVNLPPNAPQGGPPFGAVGAFGQQFPQFGQTGNRGQQGAQGGPPFVIVTQGGRPIGITTPPQGGFTGQNGQLGNPIPNFPPANVNPAGVVASSPPLIVPGRVPDELAGTPPMVLGPSGMAVAFAAPTAFSTPVAVQPLADILPATSGATRSRPMFFSQLLKFFF